MQRLRMNCLQRWIVMSCLLGVGYLYFYLNPMRRGYYGSPLTSYDVNISTSLDLRIIVLVYNRHESVRRCLQSLHNLVLDGDKASIDIWVDRSVDGTIHEPTLRAVSNFHWDLGPVRVHQQATHAGIHGQWIDTWRPGANSKEIAIFLEDDVDLSPYAYRWLKAAYFHFKNQEDIAGYSLYENAVANFKHPSDLLFLHSKIGTHAL